MTKSIKSIINYFGTDALLVSVECHITNGLPAVLIIGYASKAVDEAKERLRAGFANSSLPFPKKRITINLAPADVPKDATSLDLAMAVAILHKSKQVEASELSEWVFLGEIGLDGALSPVKGIIGRILQAKKMGLVNFYLPASNLEQAMMVPEVTLKPANSLKDVYLDLAGVLTLKAWETGGGKLVNRPVSTNVIDLSEIIGQPIAKRALEIAAAGHHNILFYGPPGTGKTMLARAMWGILPELNHTEMLEVTHIHSLGSSGYEKITSQRPFRSPHHTSSAVSLTGGGTRPKPGEISLAHRGVLFLDELPEFRSDCLEALRQPLEDGEVTIARIKDSATYPADFILVATQNPCPCGYYGTDKACSCSASVISKYQRKVSGPVVDRIDLHLPVNSVDHRRLLSKIEKTESYEAKKRVQKAYDAQQRRFGVSRYNSSLNNREIREKANLTDDAKNLLDIAATKLQISARAYVRTVKVARTIADLAGCEDIKAEHISEALQYRQQLSAF